MRFCCHEPKGLIRKARTKIITSDTYKRASSLSRKMAKAVEVDLVRGITTFKKNIPPEEVYNAWKNKSYQQLMQTIPFKELPRHMSGVHGSITETALGSAELSIKSLPAPVKNSLRWDTKNPSLSNFINGRTGELVQGITVDTQRVIQDAVTRSFDNALTPTEIGETIKDSIGLGDRYSNAVENYYDGLIDSGADPSEATELSSDYADRLLTSRANTISRTETRMAANEGQMAVWDQAEAQGLIPAESKRIWIVDGDPCPVCEPMDGIPADENGYWYLNNGDVVDNPTDSHPNCFCGVELDIPEWKDPADELPDDV